MFDNLYFILTGTLTCFFCGSFFSNHYTDQVPFFIKICKGETDPQKNSFKSPSILLALTLTVSITTFIFYYSAKKFVNSKSKSSKKPPEIFGRWQRNVVTLTQTLWYNIIVMFLMVSQLCLMYVYNYTQSPNLHTFLLIYPLALDFIFFLLPLFILFKVHRSIPDIVTSNRVSDLTEKYFYSRTPIIQPRRDFVTELTSIPVPTVSRIIFVREEN